MQSQLWFARIAPAPLGPSRLVVLLGGSAVRAAAGHGQGVGIAAGEVGLVKRRGQLRGGKHAGAGTRSEYLGCQSANAEGLAGTLPHRLSRHPQQIGQYSTSRSGCNRQAGAQKPSPHHPPTHPPTHLEEGEGHGGARAHGLEADGGGGAVGQGRQDCVGVHPVAAGRTWDMGMWRQL